MPEYTCPSEEWELLALLLALSLSISGKAEIVHVSRAQLALLAPGAQEKAKTSKLLPGPGGAAQHHIFPMADNELRCWFAAWQPAAAPTQGSSRY